MVTSEWPTAERPHAVPFVVHQVDFLRRAGVQVDLFYFRGAQSPVRYLKAWRQLRKQFRLGDYHLFHAQFGQSAVLHWPSSLPLVVTLHGDDILGVKNEGGRTTLKGRLLQQFLRLISRRAGAVIIVSDQMRSHIPRSVPLHLLPTGVDIESLPTMSKAEARRQLGLAEEGRLVLFVGNPADPYKRHVLAEQAMNELRRETPAELVVGWNRTHHEILVLMQAADVLLVTSSQEGSPTVVKEALASNLPIVSVAVGDVVKRLQGVEGCEIADASPEALAKSLARILKRGRRTNGRESVRELDENVLTGRLIEIYRSVMKSARGQRGTRQVLPPREKQTQAKAAR
jgi:glycosyltransferase involved in cell wall biosynthesis